MESVVIEDVRYDRETVSPSAGCFGCAAQNSRSLCDKLNKFNCLMPNSIWKENEEYKKLKEARELSVFFGGAPFPAEAEKALYEGSNGTSDYDLVKKPKHYMLFEDKNIEVRDVIEKLVAKIQGPFPTHSPLFESDYVQLMQYLMRFMDKNGKQDLEKARWYLDKMIAAYDN